MFPIVFMEIQLYLSRTLQVEMGENPPTPCWKLRVHRCFPWRKPLHCRNQSHQPIRDCAPNTTIPFTAPLFPINIHWKTRDSKTTGKANVCCSQRVLEEQELAFASLEEEQLHDAEVAWVIQEDHQQDHI